LPKNSKFDPRGSEKRGRPRKDENFSLSGILGIFSWWRIS
jgi:hypothetical protein